MNGSTPAALPQYLEPSRDEAERFLRALDADATAFTFQTFCDEKDRPKREARTLARVLHDTLDQHWARLCALSRRGAGVFVTVNRTNLKGRRKGDIVAVRACIADFDRVDIDRIVEQLAKFELTPHVIVESSPGNFHAYWRIEEEKVDWFTPAQQRLNAVLGSDPAVKDLPRVMRLPGFPHQKNPPALFITQIVRIDERQPYSAEAFVKALAVADETTQRTSGANVIAFPDLGAATEGGLPEPIDWTRGYDEARAQHGAHAPRRAVPGLQRYDGGATLAKCMEWNLLNRPPLDDEEVRDVVSRLAEKERTQRATEGRGLGEPRKGLFMLASGLWFYPEEADAGPPLWISDPFQVVAQTRDDNGNSWGLLLEWKDHDGQPHTWAMPRELLAGDGAEVRRILSDGGLRMGTGRKQRDQFLTYLNSIRVTARARCVDRRGWHGRTYVAATRTYGPTDDERVVLQMAGLAPEHVERGTLEGWQSEVAALAVGNSRLALAVSAAFAGPLLKLLDEEPGGFHLAGASSVGKTTALLLAVSVWGSRFRSWRTTDNAAESLARAANDGLLCLDELSEVDARVAGALVYMLANGLGKARMRRDVTARPVTEWRTVLLSSGEGGLAEKLAEQGPSRTGGTSRAAGRDPRRRGAWAWAVRKPARQQRWRRVRTTVEGGRRSASRPRDQGFSRAPLVRHRRDRRAGAPFSTKVGGRAPHRWRRWSGLACGQSVCPHRCGGRGRNRDGHSAWPAGEASHAAAMCFQAWIDRRGGAGSAEIDAGIRGGARF
jgi:putative DNA primase/helicase